jgi:outer membrane protein
MKYSGPIALIVSLCLLLFVLIEKLNGNAQKKIGIVQLDKLVYEFKGMKEASERYSLKMKKWELESDSLENRLKELYRQIQLDSINKDNAKLERDTKVFLMFRQSYMEYSQNIQQNAQEEDKQMTTGVMNQINDYIKKYAEEKGFDVIFCNNQGQSVGYAKENMDVTKDVLDFANAQYSGEK